MGWDEDIQRFEQRLEADAARLHDGLADDTLAGIVEGSSVTGAPGQPERTGNLKRSWGIARLSRWVTLVFSDSPYARKVEQASQTTRTGGGPHSIKLTRASWNNLVQAVLGRIRS